LIDESRELCLAWPALPLLGEAMKFSNFQMAVRLAINFNQIVEQAATMHPAPTQNKSLGFSVAKRAGISLRRGKSLAGTSKHSANRWLYVFVYLTLMSKSNGKFTLAPCPPDEGVFA
jgi:hypothetical protein